MIIEKNRKEILESLTAKANLLSASITTPDLELLCDKWEMMKDGGLYERFMEAYKKIVREEKQSQIGNMFNKVV